MEQGNDAAPSTSLAARMFNVYATPGDVFEEVAAAKPSTANWLAPTLLSCLAAVAFVLVAFSQPAILQQVREQQDKVFQKNVAAGKMTQSQAEQAQKFLDKMGPTVTKVTGSIGAVLAGFAWVFAAALVLWLIGRWVCKAQFPYLKAVEVAGLAGMITALGTLVAMLLAVARGNLAMTPGPALFLREFDVTNKTHLMLSSLNIMTLWYVGVLAMGLARLSRASFGRAACWLYGLWAGSRLLVILSGWGSQGM